VIPDKAHIGYFQQVYDSRNRAQAGTFLWQVDYPAPSDFLSLLSCATFQPASPNSLNAAEYCNPTLDARMRAASRLQQENPQLANQRWSAVEHTLVDAAPWLPLLNARSPELFSRRVGGYRYNPVYGTLIDQLWVH
jgi:ABC-type oligopeptide transport system substrate-binding subunit